MIYLGLRRLFPLAQEDSNLSITRSRKQDTEYKQWFDKYYRAILPTEKVFEYENYNSDNKNFLSVVTTDFDSYGSSAGQDNLSQILTAIYAFKCLKENKGKDYRG